MESVLAKAGGLKIGIMNREEMEVSIHSMILCIGFQIQIQILICNNNISTAHYTPSSNFIQDPDRNMAFLFKS